MLNQYSATWFRTFLQSIPPAQTESEVAFIQRQLPQARFSILLDLCCGMGRHARLLIAHGYRVLGLDRDMDALLEAQRLSEGRMACIAQDMRHLAGQPSQDLIFSIHNKPFSLDISSPSCIRLHNSTISL